MDSDRIQEYYDFLLPLIKSAGNIILEANTIEVESKDEIYDLVTMYDRKVEQILVDRLKREYPQHEFIGEEESSLKHRIPELTERPTWIIDPIDGTANFVRGMPIVGISVGLVIGKQLQIGVVYNPFMNELYTAIKGQGACLNGVPIHTSQLSKIGGAVFAYELSLARNDKYRNLYLSRLMQLIPVIQGIRSYGCASLSLCFVASGVIDAYQCDGLFPWDAAAGVLIVREAGGFVCDTHSGGEFDLMRPNFLAAANRTLAKQFITIEMMAAVTDENVPPK